MPLYDPDHVPEIAPEDAIVVVHRFLRRCHAWAEEREIPRRVQRVGEAHDLDEAGKLVAWIAWLRFTEHAIHEIEDGALDHWFAPGG